MAWARNGAIVGLGFAAAGLLIPADNGLAYNAWGEWHGAMHNLTAIATLIVVGALSGATAATALNRRR